MKILIVDDEDLIRTVIKEYCSNSNYETEEASSGKEALELLKNKNWNNHKKDIIDIEKITKYFKITLFRLFFIFHILITNSSYCYNVVSIFS